MNHTHLRVGPHRFCRTHRIHGSFLRLLLLWAAVFAVFGTPYAQAQETPATAVARIALLPETRQAVGTVRPRTETRIEAQITARILEIRAQSGSRVHRGDVLVVLDTRELEARSGQAQQDISSAAASTRQARQALAAAEAEFVKAEAHYRRIRTLHETGTVARSEMDQAEAAYAQAEAEVRRARDGVSGAQSAEARAGKMREQAQIALEYGEIRALDDGEVVRREAEPGDLAFPGKPLLVLQTGGSLRLEAQVREGLIGRVRPGTPLSVVIGSLSDVPLTGTVEEVIPAADPLSRTFEVRVGLPAVPDLYPGMFGRLLIPVGETETVLVPAAAVSRVGQLETVRVRDGERETPVYVKTGRTYPAGQSGTYDEVEILSGLRGGETVVLEAGYAR